jgi:catalase
MVNTPPTRDVVLEGAFTPAPEARVIVEEAIFVEGTRPVIARFLPFAVPTLPDNHNGSDDGTPRTGLGLKIKAANGDDFHIEAIQQKTSIAGTSAYPVSYAQAKYLGVGPVKFTNDKGLVVYVRYQFVPRAEERYLAADERKALSESHLHDEIVKRVAANPVMFDWYAQIAAKGDVIGDPSIAWPERRELVKLGTFTLTGTLTGQPAGP